MSIWQTVGPQYEKDNPSILWEAHLGPDKPAAHSSQRLTALLTAGQLAVSGLV